MTNDPHFEKNLQQYALLNRTRLDAPVTDNLSNHWLGYAAAAGSAMALAGSAEAVVIYSGIQNVSVSVAAAGTDTDTAAIDLDGGGAELRIGAFYSFGSADASAFVDASGVTNPAQFLVNTNNNELRQLSAGATISTGAGTFAGGGANRVLAFADFYTNVTQGTWTNSNPNFAGVQFNIGGNTHFGWIQLHMENVGINADPQVRLTAIDWAYEDVAGASIQAGQTTGGANPAPEPTTHALLLLGGGAMGLAAWRRRKKQRAAAAH